MTSSIIQDNKGYIWLSTPGKISRYDGYEFKTYDSESLKIPDNRFTQLTVDKSNNIWFVTGRDLYAPNYSGIIDIEKDTIYSVTAFSKGLIKSSDILYMNQSTLNKEEFFIVTRQGIVYKYSDTFEKIYRLPELPTSPVICQQHPDGVYWIMYNNSLSKVVNQQQKKLHLLPKFKHGLNSRVFTKIIRYLPTIILESSDVTLDNQYWELKDNQLVSYQTSSTLNEKIQGFFPIDAHSNCLITTTKILIQNKLGDTIFQLEDFGKSSYGSVKVKYQTSLIDKQNIIWISTENGLLKITRKKNPFTVLAPKNSIRGIYSKANQVWIGGYQGNILYNSTKDTSKIFFESPLPISGFCKDTKGHLWAGTAGFELLEYLPTREEPIIHPLKRNLMAFLPFENPITKKLWVGTDQKLAYFDKTTKQLISTDLLSPSINAEIRHFHLNEAGIWIITSKGLFLMDAQNETILKHYTRQNGLPYDNLNHLHEDKDGSFWLATKGGGLIRWNRHTKVFKQFKQREGLSNDNLYAAYEDDFGYLWLPSDFGLNRFNKKTLRDNEVFLPQNGIAHEEFNTYAHHQAADGTLYFGGLNGVTTFHPKNFIQVNSTELPLYLTDIKVLEAGKDIFLNKTKEFLEAQQITLKPKDNILEVAFSLLDYAESTSKQYAYRTQGNPWTYTKENSISLMNLPYGNFSLDIKGRGASGNWSKKVFSIPITVLKPFYLQWWFILFMISFAIIGIVARIKWSLKRLQKDKERLEKEVQKRTQQIERDKALIQIQANELKQLDKAKTNFFSNITHEFRTPLTLVIGPLQQMVKAPEELISKAPLQNVLRNAKSLLQLINQLLDISKLEAGKMKIEVAKGDIVAYTQELVNGFKTIAVQKNQRLAFFFPKQEWEIQFDKHKWDKIIYNLLSNAIKFTPSGGAIQLSLSKLSKQEEHWVCLKVRDSGIGVAENQLPQIFDRFYQADASSTRHQEGTGIGLSLVKELVEIQGGEIWVTSKIGKGTSFDIQLPILQVGQKAIVPMEQTALQPDFPLRDKGLLLQQNRTPSSNPLVANSAKLHLLLIEDNAEMRKYIRSCIDTSRFHILEAQNGQEGIEKAQKHIPDLIISDVMMPIKDGFAVTESVRSNVVTSHIPIILLTAKASLESRLEGLQRGADAYLSKPFSPEELVLRIQKLIEIRQLLQERYKSFTLIADSSKNATPFVEEDAFITKIKKFLEDNIDNTQLNGDIIGAAFNMSRMQLHRKLKALTNQSTSELILAVRLEIALPLLKEKTLNIAEISYQTGFSSPNYFSRVFKKKYGKSPSHFLE